MTDLHSIEVHKHQRESDEHEMIGFKEQAPTLSEEAFEGLWISSTDCVSIVTTSSRIPRSSGTTFTWESYKRQHTEAEDRFKTQVTVEKEYAGLIQLLE